MTMSPFNNTKRSASKPFKPHCSSSFCFFFFFFFLHSPPLGVSFFFIALRSLLLSVFFLLSSLFSYHRPSFGTYKRVSLSEMSKLVKEENENVVVVIHVYENVSLRSQRCSVLFSLTSLLLSFFSLSFFFLLAFFRTFLPVRWSMSPLKSSVNNSNTFISFAFAPQRPCRTTATKDYPLSSYPLLPFLLFLCSVLCCFFFSYSSFAA